MLTDSEIERIGTLYGDTRTLEDFREGYLTGNAREDEAVKRWVAAHNDLGLDCIMSATPLGERSAHIEKMEEDPGDAMLSFRGDRNFDVPIEVKTRRWQGSTFRPRECDVRKCIRENRIYVVLQNYGEPIETMFLLTPDQDMPNIECLYKTRTEEENGKKVYGGKPYYRISVRDYRKVDFKTLQPMKKYLTMLDVLQRYAI